MKKRIVNCFYNNCHGGIGDFLRGSIYLYKFCKQRNLDFSISFKHHDISKFIKTKKEPEFKENEIIDIYKKSSESFINQLGSFKNFCKSMKSKIEELIFEVNNNIYLFLYTNYSDLFLLEEKDIIPSINHTEGLTKDCQKWFKENIVFSNEINQSANKELFDLNLEVKNFNILHFRLGDQNSFLGLKYSSRQVDFFSMFEICNAALKKDLKPILLLSDNNKLKKYITKKAKEQDLPIFSTHFNSQHSQKKPSTTTEKEVPTSEQGNFNLALDMKLITMSNKVDSYSVYFWGSGFITWISKIYNIPFKSSAI